MNLFSKMIGIRKVVNDFHDPFTVLVKSHYNNSFLVNLARFCEKLSLKTCDGAITVSELCEEVLTKNHKRKMFLVRNYPSTIDKLSDDIIHKIQKTHGDRSQFYQAA